MLLKIFVRKILKIFNLRISYYRNLNERYLKIIKSEGINVIYDIGANSGQFTMSVLDSGYKGKIISFEPISNIHIKLKKNAKKFNNWIVHEPVAVGEKCKKVTINVAGNSAQSSSILKMGDTHKESAPKSKYIGVEEVKLITLDSIFYDYHMKGNKYLLKIDAQGYEEQVLNGAINCINEIDAVKIECSLLSLYEGDKTFEYYFQFFQKKGFKLFDIDAGFSNPITGQLLQFDALFVKE